MSPAPVRRLLPVLLVVVALLGGVLLGRALPTAPGEASVDVGFARDMANHHAQAVAMATTAVQRAPSPEVRTLATDILLTQQNQIGRMQAMLRSWDRPQASPGRTMQWMAGEGHAGHGASPEEGATGPMPGMATAAELAELQQLAGEDLEVRFLQLVLRHHQGGFAMAEHARDRATTEEVRELAGAIAASQSQEAVVLEDLLRERGGEPLPLAGA